MTINAQVLRGPSAIPTVGPYVTLVRWRTKYVNGETSKPTWPLHHIPTDGVSMSTDGWPCRRI